jgi:hypothetical protein
MPSPLAKSTRPTRRSLSRPTSSAALSTSARPSSGYVGGWKDAEGIAHYSSALLEPAEALSIANAILAAVGQALGGSDQHTERAVAEAIAGRDWDREVEALLGQGDA